jgi:hypothetical protein
MRRLIGIAVFGLTIGATSVALAVCTPIAGSTITTSIARWRTLTGSDQVWVNNIFDGQSGEPTFPQFQEVGFLASGSTWNSATLGTIQDSSTSECDNVEIRSSIKWWTFSNTCDGAPEGIATASLFADTCSFGSSAKFFTQGSPTVFGLSSRPSYQPFANVYRNGTMAGNELGNPCVRVSAVSTGCN